MLNFIEKNAKFSVMQKLFYQSTMSSVHYFLPPGLYQVAQVLRVLLVTRKGEKCGIVENLMDHWEERCKDKGVEEMLLYVGVFLYLAGYQLSDKQTE